MSSHRTEYFYVSEFVGKLRVEPERVPVHVCTELTMMTDEAACDVWKNKNSRHHVAPQYVYSGEEDLSLPLILQASGLHYFMWSR